MAADPFSSKSVLKLPLIVDALAGAWHGFQLDDELESKLLHLADVEKAGLPDLQPDALRLSLDRISAKQLDVTESTRSSQNLEDPEQTDRHDELRPDDLWELAGSSQNASENLLVSWDCFTDNERAEPDAKLYSEAGSAMTDVLNADIWQSLKHQPLRYAKVDQLQHALVNLILGHGSAFFEWDHSSSSFRHPVDNYALRDHTCEITRNTCDLFDDCGASFRRISTQCQSDSNQTPTSHAIRSSILEVLYAIESDLIGRSPYTMTVIELTEVAQAYLEILRHMEEFMLPVLLQSNEVEVVTAVIYSINETWTSKAHLRVLMTQLASRILRPAISAMEEQLGLSVMQPAGDTTQGWLLSKLMPSHHGKFLEAIECLTAVQMHAPRIVPLNQLTKVGIVQKWVDIVGMQQTADKLEKQAVESLSWRMIPYSEARSSSPIAEASALTDDSFTINFFMEPVNDGGTQFPNEHESFVKAIAAAFEPLDTQISSVIPPLHALELSVAPFLETQHRTSSCALMKTLFLELDLVAHLDRLHAFQLFGNGLFAVRLSRALFDAEQNCAGGRRKTGLTAGLRLEDREVWPPASSELRLVLMGLLSESATDRRPDDITESMSFAIRELSDAELELCRDVHSIHALDFLRFTYAPPNPVLELVITSLVLDKYDRIFKFLLVLLRMHSLTQSLTASISLRPSSKSSPTYRKLCIKLHCFVSSFIDYALNMAIKIPWDHFSKTARSMHRHVFDGRYGESLSIAGSIAQFRQLHDDTLDDILKSLLLKRKQAKAYDLTCKMFSLALRFVSTATAFTKDQEAQAFYKQYEELMRSLLSQIETIVASNQDPSLKRLDALSLKINGNHYYKVDDG